MVEVIAATAGALLTACFVSVGSISLRNRQQRDDLVRIQTSVEALSERVIDVHTDVKDIYSRLRHVDIELAKLNQAQ
jgi:hypothetical protein